MTHVLIAADDTEESVHAATTARELFGDAAHYTVVSVARTDVMWAGSSMAWGVPYTMAIPPAGVAGPPLVFGQPTSAPHETPVDLAERQADEVSVAAHLTHVEARGDVGDPADAIVRVAEEVGADVIVLGSHDRNWFSRLLTRSVSKDVVRDSPVPVLVVR